MLQEVTHRTTAPYSAVCYIEASFSNGPTLRGSGVVIGANDVLTALHLVYQADFGGWATSVRVIPAADTFPYSAPFGEFFDDEPSIDGRAANWDLNDDGLLTDDEAQGDLAVIGLHSRIGDAAGWLPTAQHSADFEGGVAGYPIAGTGMMAEVVFADASAQYGVYDTESSLGPGASGGPLLYFADGQFFVAGVLSSGNLLSLETTYAAVFGEGTASWLAGVTAANDVLIGANPQTAITGTEGADLLVGNALDNVVVAAGGDDSITGAAGNDLIDGGAGLDVAVYAGPFSGYVLSLADTGFAIADGEAGRDGTDNLMAIERLRFADAGVALDVDGNAGTAARIIGAVFGAPAVDARADYAGIGLWHLDRGMSYEALVQLALDAQLGVDAENDAVVELLYLNVLGATPSSDAAAYYVGLLDSGQYTQAGLGVFAAESEPAGNNVDLAGLASTGMFYLPVA